MRESYDKTNIYIYIHTVGLAQNCSSTSLGVLATWYPTKPFFQQSRLGHRIVQAPSRSAGAASSSEQFPRVSARFVQGSQPKKKESRALAEKKGKNTHLLFVNSNYCFISYCKTIRKYRLFLAYRCSKTSVLTKNVFFKVTCHVPHVPWAISSTEANWLEQAKPSPSDFCDGGPKSSDSRVI